MLEMSTTAPVATHGQLASAAAATQMMLLVCSPVKDFASAV